MDGNIVQQMVRTCSNSLAKSLTKPKAYRLPNNSSIFTIAKERQAFLAVQCFGLVKDSDLNISGMQVAFIGLLNEIHTTEALVKNQTIADITYTMIQTKIYIETVICTITKLPRDFFLGHRSEVPTT